MTPPDVSRKTRNMFLIAFPLLAGSSYVAAHTASFWLSPFDYWLAWTSFATGFASVGAGLGAAFSHVIYLSDLRTN